MNLHRAPFSHPPPLPSTAQPRRRPRPLRRLPPPCPQTRWMISRRFFPVALRLSRGLLRGSSRRGISTMAGGGGEESQLGEFFEYMERLRNYERSGVPRGAGTDSDDGFDLGRMRRLLRRLGDPHTHFPAVHIAGTKGKGSTAAFLSNIMREQGYNVGCYSSPHLLTICERISVGNNGGPASAGLLRDLFDEAKRQIIFDGHEAVQASL